MKWTSAVGSAALAFVSIGGCASPSAPSAACQPVAAERAAAILGSAGGVTVDKAGAVKSSEHKSAYYVAIRFSGPGVDKQVGVWATNGLDSGSVYSVDAFAEQFSGLPKMDGFSTTDEGAEAARSCV